MFGEKDILLGTKSSEKYTAVSNCHLLSLSRNVFFNLMEEFPDFRDDVLYIAKERQRLQLKILISQKEKLGLPIELN
jgi:CRP-like cAMP-binding protein